MLKGLEVKALAKKIIDQKSLKRDYVVPTSLSTLLVLPPLEGEIKKQIVMETTEGTFPLQPLAHDQIGAHTRIPAPYYDRMLAEAPDLLATNVNAWHRINPARRMVRTLKRVPKKEGEKEVADLRAFLSDRYQRIENDAIAEAALPVLYDLPGMRIVSSEVTDKRLYIHFVVDTIQGEVKRGDVVQAGGIIQNSEVGCGAASVSGLLWRLICLNGMKTGDTFRRHHVGRKISEDGEMDWADDTRQADDKVVLLKIRDMVKAVVDETKFRVNLQKMQGLTEGKITGDPSKAVEVLAQAVGTSDTEKGSILRSLVEGGDLSAWGLLNAVTAQSHTARSYDRAVELEAAGGMLLDLPHSEWRKVLEAA